MMDLDHHLTLAIEDNVAWCEVVCATHDLDERLSESIWVNLRPSPRFYPNIITRRRGAQATVIKAIDEIRARGAMPRWGIKDSYADLDLDAFGFQPVIEANWYIRHPQPAPASALHSWACVTTAHDLLAWEDAWNGEDRQADEQRLFRCSILNAKGVAFWQRGFPGKIHAGFITHDSMLVVGLSNWFCANEETLDGQTVVSAAAALFPQRSIVFWSAGDASSADVVSLGPLRVWISTE